MSDSSPNIRQRSLLFTSWVVLSCLVFIGPLIALVKVAVSSEDATHVLIVPCISAAVLFIERRRIFQTTSSSPAFGIGVLFVAICLSIAAIRIFNPAFADLRAFGLILSLDLVWVAGFLLIFGTCAARAALFPLLFLFLMIPQPDFLVGHAIYLLRVGSAWITGIFFDLFGIPALRDGFAFHLARVNIEIAKECSGIRSSMVLLILGLLVAHFRLQHFWKKAAFIAVSVFLMIFKNGIRIVTLTWLGSYVNPGFLTGRLHRDGGIVFFVLSLLLLWPVLRLLERTKESDAALRKPAPVRSG